MHLINTFSIALIENTKKNVTKMILDKPEREPYGDDPQNSF